ncbi:MAG: fluoride efflux transporter CrcB [Paracoccaceae bacterium]|nr:fluoride efflux transporter CrcB [Paracoccaceae bacterium]
MGAFLSVAVGGAIGATLRWLVVRWATHALGPGFPWGTVIVNVAGSVAMGVLAVLLMERFPGAWGRYAPFLMTGVLGGFTTFSAFSLDALFLIERGRNMAAAGYMGASVLLSIAGLWAGLALARGVWGP